MISSPRTITRWLLAEGIGTALLSAVVAVSFSATAAGLDGYLGLFAPFAVGLFLMLWVYLTASITGAHLNPAISLAFLIFRRMNPFQFAMYLIAQFLGAWGGALIGRVLLGFQPLSPERVSAATVTGEFIGTFLFVFAVTAVAYRKVSDQLAGLVIGVALAIGLTLAAVSGGGLLNPAVALALGSYQVVYLIVPILGGLTGAALAVIFHESEEPTALT